ncbi:MAG: response regulator [Planctomycetota bacterium]
MSEQVASPGETSSEPDGPTGRPKVLHLGGSHDREVDVAGLLGPAADVVGVSSPLRALALLAKGGYTALYVDADHFGEAADIGKLIRNDRVLRGMPNGVVLLDEENLVLWENGRLAEWTGGGDAVSRKFYEVLGSPEILGPDYCPLNTARSKGQASTSVLKSDEATYYRLHAAPIIESPGTEARHLVVSVIDVTEEMVQQQKLAAIHQAGVELADLTTEEVASLSAEERIDLLSSNILHCIEDVLQLDVVEIRMLEQATGELVPVLAVGMAPEAAERSLVASKEGYGVTGFVAATGSSYLCEQTSEDPLYLEGARGARSSLTVPLMLHDQVIGTLNVESPEASAFNESDQQFLEIFARSVALALNTLDLLAAQKASTAAQSVEAIHSAVALPVDGVLNDAVNIMERYIGHEPEVVERLQRILKNTREIKKVIQKVGQTMAPTQAQPTDAVEQRPMLAGKRLLVVDADQGVRSAAHELLDRYGCIVETAHDGNEARFMVRNLGPGFAYDAILSDIRLPDMNGYELLMKLREIMDSVPLILMSGFGYDPGHSVIKARAEGVQHVLYKPFRLDQLLTAVQETLARAER